MKGGTRWQHSTLVHRKVCKANQQPACTDHQALLTYLSRKGRPLGRQLSTCTRAPLWHRETTWEHNNDHKKQSTTIEANRWERPTTLFENASLNHHPLPSCKDHKLVKSQNEGSDYPRLTFSHCCNTKTRRKYSFVADQVCHSNSTSAPVTECWPPNVDIKAVSSHVQENSPGWVFKRREISTEYVPSQAIHARLSTGQPRLSYLKQLTSTQNGERKRRSGRNRERGPKIEERERNTQKGRPQDGRRERERWCKQKRFDELVRSTKRSKMWYTHSFP